MTEAIVLQPCRPQDVQSQSKQESLRIRILNIVKKFLWALAIIFNPIVDFFTQGLSDFLGLKTLRHGTTLNNYLNIRVHGADPNFSGRGASKIMTEKRKEKYKDGLDLMDYPKHVQGYFHVLNDSDSVRLPVKFLIRNVYARFYCGISSAYASDWKGFNFLKVITVPLSVLFVPTVKFRFKPEDISTTFEADTDHGYAAKRGAPLMDMIPPKGEEERYCNLAYRTKKKIGTEHIGLRGILTQGLDGHIWARMKANPGKTIWGLIKLINPIGLLLLVFVGMYYICKKTWLHFHKIEQQKLT